MGVVSPTWRPGASAKPNLFGSGSTRNPRVGLKWRNHRTPPDHSEESDR